MPPSPETREKSEAICSKSGALCSGASAHLEPVWPDNTGRERGRRETEKEGREGEKEGKERESEKLCEELMFSGKDKQDRELG